MMKKQKILIIVFASLFAVLTVLYFAVIKPLVSTGESEETKLELLDGEVKINDKLTNFYIFEPIERSSMQSIEVENEYGTYKIYRDSSDKFQLDGYMGLTFNSEKFSSLVVTSGTPTAMMRVTAEPTEEELAEYGLDKPQARWTVTTTTGEEFTMYVGGNLLTEGGYYVRYADRDAVYIMSNTLADTILSPVEVLIDPILLAGMSQNEYYMVDDFTVWHGEELFVHISRVPDSEKKDPSAITEVKMNYPLPEGGGADGDGTYYEANDNKYFQILYSFISLKGDSVVCFAPNEEELTEYGLSSPAYSVIYTFKDYTFVLFVSEKQADGSYYAVSNVLGYTAVCSVSADTLGWLEDGAFKWIMSTPFFENIKDVSRITLKGSGIDVDYRLSHSTDADENALLDVTEVNSGTEIPNKDVRNFREYYKTLLNITNQQYAELSDEDRAALISDESKVILEMTYEKSDGTVCEYKFYKYYSASEDKLSSGKIFVTVNGTGEFYTTNDLVNKVINDTPRVLAGLDVDPYGHK